MNVHLQPGEWALGHSGDCLRTVLGSCVAITLWHPARRIGTMCHFVLPCRNTRIWANPAGADARYAGGAMALMVRALVREGIDPRHCQAKVFGGGRMFPGRSPGLEGTGIGDRNGQASLELLASYGIPLTVTHLLGTGHRTIHFELTTGLVRCRQITQDAPGHGPVAAALVRQF